MATQSSILAWRIPWTDEPGGLQSTRSLRVRQKTMTNTQTDGKGTPTDILKLLQEHVST